jgi:ABC-type nitrate/sulfonate/bicarbonate transport system ATPase subunit
MEEGRDEPQPEEEQRQRAAISIESIGLHGQEAEQCIRLVGEQRKEQALARAYEGGQEDD